jgi:hypothetical protein
MSIFNKGRFYCADTFFDLAIKLEPDGLVRTKWLGPAEMSSARCLGHYLR